jgi:uncharacterized protein YbjT (DUF2867 family)
MNLQPLNRKKNMITIMGATGFTGKKITEALLKAGEKVRALGRSESKLAELSRAGAETLAGDTTDPVFLTKAFWGADAVYTLLPTDRRATDYRAEHDIAEIAAQALKARTWKGVIVVEILGPRDLSFSEATRLLGKRIGKPDLQYVQFSYADETKALVQAGMSESFAGLYAEMTRAFNEGRVKPQKGRTPANTTPTRFEDFAGELARAYAAAS